MASVSKPARIWMGTIPFAGNETIIQHFNSDFTYAIGQREIGDSTGYEHWQVCVWLKSPQRRSYLTGIFGRGTHWEPTRSAAAIEYCRKEDTRVDGSGFEWGTRPLNRSDPTDWDAIRNNAKCGRLELVPPDVYVRSYLSLTRIARDHLQPTRNERKVVVYWGKTGTGKSRRAWEEATDDAFPKDPRTKFWDGYRDQENVVIDEFRGGIDISHLLRWFDRYPCIIEVKGSSTVLKATSYWITSNIPPHQWYPDVDQETLGALLRRMEVLEFQ